MMLRRAMVLASLIVYLGVGVCRQACALDLPAFRPEIASVAASSNHCHDEAPASRDHSRRTSAPCCVRGSGDASVLLQAAGVPTAPVSSVAFFAVNPIPVISGAETSSYLATRAPPGSAPSVSAEALHGPRPPPSIPAVL